MRSVQEQSVPARRQLPGLYGFTLAFGTPQGLSIYMDGVTPS